VLAEASIRRALDILRKSAGLESLAVALAEYRLAQSFLMQGRSAEAEPLLQHSLRIERRTYPQGHRIVADTLSALAEAQRLQGNVSESEANFRRSIAIYGESGGPGLVAALEHYAMLLRPVRKIEAKALEKQAKEMRKTLLLR